MDYVAIAQELFYFTIIVVFISFFAKVSDETCKPSNSNNNTNGSSSYGIFWVTWTKTQILRLIVSQGLSYHKNVPRW